MSGRSISTDSGFSSVDDSRLSQSSSEYAASPATTATTDSSDEAQVLERGRRRSLRHEVEPPLKVFRRATNTAKQSATTTITSRDSTSSVIAIDNKISCGSSISSGSNQCPLISLTAPPSTNGAPALGFLQSKSVSPFAKPSTAAASFAAVKEVPCRWKDCVFVTSKDNDLADHIADAHVGPQGDSGSFVCLWESCKVSHFPFRPLFGPSESTIV